MMNNDVFYDHKEFMSQTFVSDLHSVILLGDQHTLRFNKIHNRSAVRDTIMNSTDRVGEGDRSVPCSQAGSISEITGPPRRAAHYLPTWERQGLESDVAFPCCDRTIIMKGRKRRAFAYNGPLIAAPAPHCDDDDGNENDDDGNEPYIHGMTSLHQNKTGTILENRTTFKHLESDSCPSRNGAQAPLPPPCSPCRTATAMMTPPRGPASSPITNELSRFGNLVIQSPFSAFSPGSKSHHSESPSSGISSIPKQQSQRLVPIMFVGSSEESPASLRNPARNLHHTHDSPRCAFPKTTLTPRTTNKSLSLGLQIAPQQRGAMQFASKATDDFDFEFDHSSSDGSLTDSNNEDDDRFFLCGPDKDLTSENAKKFKQSISPLPTMDHGVNRSSSKEANDFSLIVPAYCAKLGSAVSAAVTESATSGTDSAPTSRYSSSSSLFGMCIVHEENSQLPMDGMAVSSFKPNIPLSKEGLATRLPFLGGATRDLITPPVMCTHASEPPPFKQRK